MNYAKARITAGVVLACLVGACQSSTDKRSGQGIDSPSTEITIDGDLRDWDQFPFLKTLTAPWKNNISDQTVFDNKTTDDFFNFYFKTIDTSMTIVPFINELSVAEDDRVELFFSPNPDLSEYYCIEMNPHGNILDYKAHYYRKMDETWDFKSIKIATSLTGDGYVVEGRIATEEMNALGLGSKFYLGIFRADYIGKDVTWFSWILPDSPDPDFHIPSALGEFRLNDSPE
jgi:hypothetical protein